MTHIVTNEQIRATLLKELADRAEDFRRDARQERAFADMCDSDDASGRGEYICYAAHWDRCAAHYQQAIDLISAAPMPAGEEAK